MDSSTDHPPSTKPSIVVIATIHNSTHVVNLPLTTPVRRILPRLGHDRSRGGHSKSPARPSKDKYCRSHSQPLYDAFSRAWVTIDCAVVTQSPRCGHHTTNITLLRQQSQQSLILIAEIDL